MISSCLALNNPIIPHNCCCCCCAIGGIADDVNVDDDDDDDDDGGMIKVRFIRGRLKPV